MQLARTFGKSGLNNNIYKRLIFVGYSAGFLGQKFNDCIKEGIAIDQNCIAGLHVYSLQENSNATKRTLSTTFQAGINSVLNVEHGNWTIGSVILTVKENDELFSFTALETMPKIDRTISTEDTVSTNRK